MQRIQTKTPLSLLLSFIQGKHSCFAQKLQPSCHGRCRQWLCVQNYWKCLEPRAGHQRPGWELWPLDQYDIDLSGEWNVFIMSNPSGLFQLRSLTLTRTHFSSFQLRTMSEWWNHRFYREWEEQNILHFVSLGVEQWVEQEKGLRSLLPGFVVELHHLHAEQHQECYLKGLSLSLFVMPR